MDPATMSDEQLEDAINNNPNPEPDPTPDPAPAPDPTPSDTPDPDNQPEPSSPNEPDEPTPDPEPQNPDPEEPPKPPSRREQLRIQQVLERAKLNNQGQPPRPQSPRRDALDYANELDADPAVIERLEADRVAAENARYQEGVQQAQSMKWETMLHVDAPQMENKYSFLDKNSPDFHPAVTHSLSTWYMQMSGYNPETGIASNPNMRWSEFTEGIMELAEEIASVKNQATATNVAQQAANTGIRPDGGAAKLNLNKAPEHMTDDELKAVISQAGI